MAKESTKMIKQLFFHFSLLPLTLLFLSTTTLAQSPALAPTAPSGPTNVTAILEKAGRYSAMIRLLQSTMVADQINKELNDTNTGLTLFAPTDDAFANLKAGALNSLSNEQKIQLVQFHLLPSFISLTMFQTVSNPVRTQAGDGKNNRFPLNVTTSGSQVNLMTGVVTAKITDTIYSDGQLALYRVNQVLLPMDTFGPPAPAPAPSRGDLDSPSSSSPSSPGTKKPDSSTPVVTKANASGAMRLYQYTGVSFAVAVIGVFSVVCDP